MTDIAVPIIAFLVFLITALQWLTNQKRLKHELFDRRYKQFEAVKKFLGSLLSGKMYAGAESNFLEETKGIRFTYSKEIYEYVDKKVYGMGVDLNVLNEEGKPPGNLSDIAAKRGEHMKQIKRELRNLDCKFIKYLQLKH
ncbi:MAG: hypothetical protein GY774_16605 [Planctomycetes bacterium]|nr:hypothetical protein [Planctomycetota bacterium]